VADNARVLVIDDDPDMLETTRLFLERRGYSVLTASSPEEGTRQITDGRPDVVVLDIMMPEGTEGFHWLWKLRKNADPAVREMPVIVVSSIGKAMGLEFKAGEADETGCYLPAQAFLDKPFDPDDLAAKIEAVLSGR